MMNRGWLVRGAGLLAVSVVAACSSGGSTTSGVLTSAPYHLHVYAQTVVDDAPFFIALKKGYFADEGLDVTYTPLAKTTLGLPGLASGQIPIVIGGNYPTMLQADEGIPAKGIPGAPGVGTQPATPAIPPQVIQALKGNVRVLVEGYSGGPNVMTVEVLPGSHIQDAGELAHKKVAVNLAGGIQTLTINAVLKADGVNPATVDYVSIPFPKMVAALKAHLVDAAALLEPFLTQAEVGDGALEVLDQLTGPTAQLPISGVFTTAAFLRTHAPEAMAFQRAMLRAQALADSNRFTVEQVLPQYIQSTPGVPSIKSIVSLIGLGVYPATIDPVPLQRVANLMFSQGLLTSPLNVTDVLFDP